MRERDAGRALRGRVPPGVEAQNASGTVCFSGALCGWHTSVWVTRGILRCESVMQETRCVAMCRFVARPRLHMKQMCVYRGAFDKDTRRRVTCEVLRRDTALQKTRCAASCNLASTPRMHVNPHDFSTQLSDCPPVCWLPVRPCDARARFRKRVA